MFLFSTHDSTIVAMLTALKAFDKRWPPYCASIVFELFEDKVGKHWVNLSYCEQVSRLFIVSPKILYLENNHLFTG